MQRCAPFQPLRRAGFHGSLFYENLSQNNDFIFQNNGFSKVLRDALVKSRLSNSKRDILNRKTMADLPDPPAQRHSEVGGQPQIIAAGRCSVRSSCLHTLDLCHLQTTSVGNKVVCFLYCLFNRQYIFTQYVNTNLRQSYVLILYNCLLHYSVLETKHQQKKKKQLKSIKYPSKV